jgi:hypothetical protein
MADDATPFEAGFDCKEITSSLDRFDRRLSQAGSQIQDPAGFQADPLMFEEIKGGPCHSSGHISIDGSGKSRFVEADGFGQWSKSLFDQ